MDVLWIDPVNTDAPFLNALSQAIANLGHTMVVRSNRRRGYDPPRNVCWSPFSASQVLPGSLNGDHVARLRMAVAYPWDWLRAARFAKTRHAKVVLVSTNLALPEVDSWGLWLLKRRGIMPVVIVHKPYRDFFGDTERSRAGRCKGFYKQAAQILVMTRYTQDLLQSLYDLPQTCFRQFPHPHFCDLLSEVRSSPSLQAELENWAGGVPVISFISSHSSEHGLEVFLAAVPELQSLLGDFRVLVVSPIFDGPMKEYLERIVKDLCVKDRFRLRWTPYTYEELLAYLSVTSVIVVPYHHATQSGVVAMAGGFGIPVVATEVGGLPELLLRGKTGELVPPCDPQRLADAIARVAAKDALPLYKHNAYEFAQSHLAPAKAAKAVCECLSEVVST